MRSGGIRYRSINPGRVAPARTWMPEQVADAEVLADRSETGVAAMRDRHCP
jgi:hypothetical protein